jgi:hypothetical protein
LVDSEDFPRVRGGVEAAPASSMSANGRLIGVIPKHFP